MRLVVSMLGVLWCASRLPSAQPTRIALQEGWTLQSSAVVRAGGAALSSGGVDTSGWHRVEVPNTVIGALVEIGQYPDPYFGMNLRKIPGATYPIGQNSRYFPMPTDSPFEPSWWYRDEFDRPAASTEQARLAALRRHQLPREHLAERPAARRPTRVAGAFRRYELDVTRPAPCRTQRARGRGVRARAVDDLAIIWVDWNPTPRRQEHGPLADVSLTDSGPVALARTRSSSSASTSRRSTRRRLTVVAEC